MSNYKRITRSRRDKQMAGVLAGIGNYFEIDPTLIRLGFVLLFFCTAMVPCALAYLVAAAIIPIGND